MENQNVFSVSEEYHKADFGDQRLTKRFIQLTETISKRPDDSFPDATGSVAELEATYRFLGNPKVTEQKILNPHFQATASRAVGSERLVIAHDSTALIFGGNSRLEEIGSLTQGKQGFLGHVALAVDRGALVRPLGVLGLRTIFRHGEPKQNKRRGGKKDATRESLRWWELVNEVEERLSTNVFPIHVMDREADDFELFSSLSSSKMRFVIRVRQDRVLCQGLGKFKKEKLFELFDGMEVIAKRDIFLSNRELSKLIGSRKRYKPRGARKARIEIAASTIKVPRPKHCPHGAEFLFLNYVHVYEVNTPEGEDAVDWKLVTTESIDTQEDVLNIVDDYRARWMIEEYFKALKTGCNYEKRQLETKRTLLNAFAVFVPIAWQLLAIRSISRQNTEASADFALSPNQIKLLRAISKRTIPETPTIAQAMLGIAALGGHIPNNGDPGWIVLARGMERFLTMEIAWNAAKECFLEDRAAFGEERLTN